MDEDSDEKLLYVCLPTHADTEGLVITVGGGPWQSEVSWTMRGPCLTATEDFQCLDEELDYDSCEKLREAFESNCPNSWVDHFNKQRDRMKIVEAQVSRSRAKAGKD